MEENNKNNELDEEVFDFNHRDKKYEFKKICMFISILTTVEWIPYYICDAKGIDIANWIQNIMVIPLVIGWIAMLISSSKVMLLTTWKVFKFVKNFIPLIIVDFIIAGLVAFFFILGVSTHLPVLFCIIGLLEYKNKE